MSIFAIGDLHLPGGDDKSMAVFGPQWENHWEKIAADWQERVHQQDIVLIPGDISWAMHLEDALPDLQMIGAMPGRKVILRGNHDYWWGAITRVRESLPDGMFALQNDAVVLVISSAKPDTANASAIAWGMASVSTFMRNRAFPHVPNRCSRPAIS